jgi:SAM-dependent methyltransferase
MDADQMDFPDAEFDFVWSWGVIHHSPDTERIIRHVWRVLKPGGEFRLMTYHRPSIGGFYSLARGLVTAKFLQGMNTEDVLSHHTDGFLAHFYTRRELHDMLVRCGFSAIETRILGQKSELIPLSGKGVCGRLKRSLHLALPDSFAERVRSVGGFFLFANAGKNSRSQTV